MAALLGNIVTTGLRMQAARPSKALLSIPSGTPARALSAAQVRALHSTPRLTRAAAAAAETEAAPAQETFQYQAEVDRLMDLIVNSLYSNKDVFLRELVSNASDALDKARFLAISRPEILEKRPELEIRIRADAANNALIIEDDGVGMTREDLISSLGTIARSGTAKFMQALKEQNKAGDSNLIGQFGVGFYSSFLVANRVRVQTRHPDSDRQWTWESEAGSHSYKIAEDPANDIVRGTRLTLFLKDEAKDLLDSSQLSNLIKLYSEFIAFPIRLWTPEEKDKQVVDEEATKKKQEEEDAKAKAENREPAKIEPIMKTVFEKEWGFVAQNDNKPLWVRTPKDVTEAEYDEFFRTTFKEFLAPLSHAHFNVEGTIEFKGLLFIPGMAPFDQQDPTRRPRNIRLYVKRVFISDQFDEDLMPRYLGFIKGVVDSADLPLNVSREILQESRIVRTIRKQLVTRSINLVKSLAEDKEKYKTFWEAFGKNIKFGVVEDQDNRAELSKLLRFPSSSTAKAPEAAAAPDAADETTSLEGYVSRMKPGQTGIFYLVADSAKQAQATPFVERILKKGYEVLYLTEPVDEYVMMNLGSYKSGDKEYKLLDVTRENLDLGEDDKAEKEALEKQSKDFEGLTQLMKTILKDQVEKVIVSSRLDSSPCILVTSQFGWSANMERIMKAQSMGQDKRSLEYMRGRRTLEINPNHPVIQGLRREVEAAPQGDKAKDMVRFMYQTALLTSGFELESPQDFASRIYNLMAENLGGEADAAAPAAAAAEPAAKKASKKSAKAAAPSSSAAPEAPKAETVEATVVSADGTNDPWGK